MCISKPITVFVLQPQQLYYSPEDSNRKNYDSYRLYLQSPHSYEDPYFDERVHFTSTADQNAQYGLKSTTNYVDFYSTRRPSYRSEQYPGSPDSWVWYEECPLMDSTSNAWLDFFFWMALCCFLKDGMWKWIT